MASVPPQESKSSAVSPIVRRRRNSVMESLRELPRRPESQWRPAKSLAAIVQLNRGSSGVVVEAPTGLAPQLAARHHVAKDPGRCEPFAESLVQVLGDAKAHIQAHDIRGP